MRFASLTGNAETPIVGLGQIQPQAGASSGIESPSENASGRSVRDARLEVTAFPAPAASRSALIPQTPQTASAPDARTACEVTSAGTTDAFTKNVSCLQIDELASRKSAILAFKTTNVPAEPVISASVLILMILPIAFGHRVKSVTEANNADLHRA